VFELKQNFHLFTLCISYLQSFCPWHTSRASQLLILAQSLKRRLITTSMRE